MRAAFKAVMDGKQVAILVPTTVLAEQHYHTFRERFKQYPVAIEVLSRFRSPTQQKKIVADLEAGAIDIIIGTHRLLSRDVKFRDLGLLVIDEEHRFGVSQKEKIKMLKQLVDVLSLSATPIPRSLHMSMTGLRDLSVIDTPPPERYPIKTYVLEYNEDIIAEAIHTEIERKGQGFSFTIRSGYIRSPGKAAGTAAPGFHRGGTRAYAGRRAIPGNHRFFGRILSHISLHHHNRIRLGYA